ncbi:MAG: TRAP transporter large permease subunit [Acidobacteria bacterium]|nr:TRAP transporter large permease subunit [Acidobacteriota bacterium]
MAAILPLVDAIGRPLGGFHIPGNNSYLSQLTLWIAFLGGVMAARTREHLTLSTAELLREGRPRDLARLFSYTIAAAVVAVLAYASVGLVKADREAGQTLPFPFVPKGIPEWWSECVMPVALSLIALQFAFGASRRWSGRIAALAFVGAVFAVGHFAPALLVKAVWPIAILILAAALLGAPVFVAMGGLALLLFFKDDVPVSAVSAEVYRLIASPTLPAIPLLTAAGYILAEGGASHRLVRFFRALFGSLPGGIAVMVAAVCAIFTTFTGGSGVTIIALGGLVYPMLRDDGYEEGFSLGLVTASGSLGLLFPPSLPVILYSVVAGVPADSLFIAGLLPGLLLIVLVAAWGIRAGKAKDRAGAVRPKFSWKELGTSFWAAKWELGLPVVVIVLFATGKASLVEAAAAACVYAIVVECFVMRDIHPVKELPAVLLKSAGLMGAVLLLLSIAMGLTSYLVDAMIPAQLLSWVQSSIHSPWVFLLVLNVLLLVLGSVLEIYSAIVIRAPLVAPMGAAFGIDPVHLGIIFLANLELGFLFPPVGLNLFLASSRFKKPLPSLYRHVVPFLLILGVGVLLITYVPAMSVGVLKLLGK